LPANLAILAPAIPQIDLVNLFDYMLRDGSLLRGLHTRGTSIPLPGDGMIDLHHVGTPNGHKVSIMLEELGLPYRVIRYDLLTGQHLTPEFNRLNPNNKLPVILSGRRVLHCGHRLLAVGARHAPH
jgi:hypothetical protein